MSVLNEENKNNVEVNFHVNYMPLAQFKKFKNYTKDFRGNYATTIQMLMMKAETLEYIMGGDQLGIQEVYEEDEPKQDENVVQTLGDE